MKGMIGLEIHTYLVTKEKLFCKCKASRERGLKENTHICPICTGQPGAKPMPPNNEALQKAIKIGLMLGCEINSHLTWMRKHYDWPDLPKGYQNTMSGSHAIPLGANGSFSGIRIGSMHLEEDPASWEPQTGKVDYNRSGLPLVEIVTAPDFKDSEGVIGWLNKLVHALSYLNIVDKNAGVKVDVNVSIPNKTERVEIKNLNSLDSIAKAILYELKRQEEEGSVRETRRFDESKGETVSMRKKEQQDDYRFIADPDLVLINVDSSLVKKLKSELPDLPETKLKKLIAKHKISPEDAEVLAKNLDIAQFFEQVAEKIDAKFALPWVTVELLRVLNWNKKELDEVDISIEHFVKLLNLVKDKKITELQAKQILNKFVPESFDPTKTEGKMDSDKELVPIIDRVVKSNKEEVQKFLSGDKKVINFLMGEVMKATNRRADYKRAHALLEKALKR